MNSEPIQTNTGETAASSGRGLLLSLGVLALLAVLGVVLYGNTIDSEFHLDDYPNLVENASIHMTSLDAESLWRAVTASVGGNRPVASLLFALNFRAGQFNVRSFHITSIICHILAGWLLFLFLRRTLLMSRFAGRFDDRAGLVALLATLVWFTHPIQTQAVTYIVQRANVLSGLFSFAALYLFAVIRTSDPGSGRRTLQWAGLLLAILLALGSKETAAILPVIILLYELFFIRTFDFGALRNKWAYVAGIIVSPAIILAADYYRFGMSLFERMGTIYQLRGFTMWERVLTEFRVLVRYITLLILPLPGRLNLEHDVPVSYGLFNPFTTVLSLLFLLGLLALGFYLARRRPLISFFIFWFFIQLAIESSFVPLELMFEHRLYLPSVSLAVILAVLLLQRRTVPADEALAPLTEPPVPSTVPSSKEGLP
jgi:hypothetical protein